MNRFISCVLCGLLLSTLCAAEDDAPPVDPQHVWNLTDLYPDIDAWSAAREEVMEKTEQIESRRGNLGDSADALYETLALVSNTIRQAGRVRVYSSLNGDEDLRNSETQERHQLSQIMVARFSESTAWIDPEILGVGSERIMGFVEEDERLSIFAHDLDNTLRNEAHTLGDEAEQTLSYFSQPFGAPSRIYSMVANSDIPWPTVTLSNGEEHRIDAQAYSRFRAGADREDRKAVFDAYWGKWDEYRSSVGLVLSSHLQTQVALAKARHYENVLERELFQDNLPPAVYRTLVTEVNKALPTLHRYFKLRQRMLGLDQMHYYDIYPPLVALDKKFHIETTKAITLDAMEVLGDDWVKMQRDSFDERWMHVFPQQGKRSGAYMSGFAYDVHPYLLLNHNDDYESLSTFAHEWGHAIHTLYARQSQPFETANYATFIAEIPSTSLELILQNYMVNQAETIDEKLFYLGFGLEQMRGTFFRQTMFAEFELALYEAVERGEALSGDRITQMYGEIVRRYHGHDEGVVIVDDLYTNEWMFVPHFYFNMYVFQYATSVTAGTALYGKILEDQEAGSANYKDLLRAGGSDYPHLLLSRAGVDLTQPEPYQAVVTQMNAIMDQMERLLEERDQ